MSGSGESRARRAAQIDGQPVAAAHTDGYSSTRDTSHTTSSSSRGGAGVPPTADALRTPQRGPVSVTAGFHPFFASHATSPSPAIRRTSSAGPGTPRSPTPTSPSHSSEARQLAPPTVAPGPANTSVDAQGNNGYCHVCGRDVPRGAWMAHQRSESHQQRVQGEGGAASAAAALRHSTSHLPIVVVQRTPANTSENTLLPPAQHQHQQQRSAASSLTTSMTQTSPDASEAGGSKRNHTFADAVRGGADDAVVRRSSSDAAQGAEGSGGGGALRRRFQVASELPASPYSDSTTSDYSNVFEGEEDAEDEAAVESYANFPDNWQRQQQQQPWEADHLFTSLHAATGQTPAMSSKTPPVPSALPSLGTPPMTDLASVPSGSQAAARLCSGRGATNAVATTTSMPVVQVHYTQLSREQGARQRARALETQLNAHLYEVERSLLLRCLRRWYAAMFVRATGFSATPKGGTEPRMPPVTKPDIAPFASSTSSVIGAPTSKAIPAAVAQEVRDSEGSEGQTAGPPAATPSTLIAAQGPAVRHDMFTANTATATLEGRTPSVEEGEGPTPLFTSKVKSYARVHVTPDGRVTSARSHRPSVDGTGCSGASSESEGQELEVMHTDVRWVMKLSTRKASSSSSSSASSASDDRYAPLRRTQEQLAGVVHAGLHRDTVAGRMTPEDRGTGPAQPDYTNPAPSPHVFHSNDQTAQPSRRQMLPSLTSSEVPRPAVTSVPSNAFSTGTPLASHAGRMPAWEERESARDASASASTVAVVGVRRPTEHTPTPAKSAPRQTQPAPLNLAAVAPRRRASVAVLEPADGGVVEEHLISLDRNTPTAAAPAFRSLLTSSANLRPTPLSGADVPGTPSSTPSSPSRSKEPKSPTQSTSVWESTAEGPAASGNMEAVRAAATAAVQSVSHPMQCDAAQPAPPASSSSMTDSAVPSSGGSTSVASFEAIDIGTPAWTQGKANVRESVGGFTPTSTDSPIPPAEEEEEGKGPAAMDSTALTDGEANPGAALPLLRAASSSPATSYSEDFTATGSSRVARTPPPPLLVEGAEAPLAQEDALTTPVESLHAPFPIAASFGTRDSSVAASDPLPPFDESRRSPAERGEPAPPVACASADSPSNSHSSLPLSANGAALRRSNEDELVASSPPAVSRSLLPSPLPAQAPEPPTTSSASAVTSSRSRTSRSLLSYSQGPSSQHGCEGEESGHITAEKEMQRRGASVVSLLLSSSLHPPAPPGDVEGGDGVASAEVGEVEVEAMVMVDDGDAQRRVEQPDRHLMQPQMYALLDAPATPQIDTSVEQMDKLVQQRVERAAELDADEVLEQVDARVVQQEMEQHVDPTVQPQKSAPVAQHVNLAAEQREGPAVQPETDTTHPSRHRRRHITFRRSRLPQTLLGLSVVRARSSARAVRESRSMPPPVEDQHPYVDSTHCVCDVVVAAAAAAAEDVRKEKKLDFDRVPCHPYADPVCGSLASVHHHHHRECSREASWLLTRQQHRSQPRKVGGAEVNSGGVAALHRGGDGVAGVSEEERYHDPREGEACMRSLARLACGGGLGKEQPPEEGSHQQLPEAQEGTLAAGAVLRSSPSGATDAVTEKSTSAHCDDDWRAPADKLGSSNATSAEQKGEAEAFSSATTVLSPPEASTSREGIAADTEAAEPISRVAFPAPPPPPQQTAAAERAADSPAEPMKGAVTEREASLPCRGGDCPEADTPAASLWLTHHTAGGEGSLKRGLAVRPSSSLRVHDAYSFVEETSARSSAPVEREEVTEVHPLPAAQDDAGAIYATADTTEEQASVDAAPVAAAAAVEAASTPLLTVEATSTLPEDIPQLSVASSRASYSATSAAGTGTLPVKTAAVVALGDAVPVPNSESVVTAAVGEEGAAVTLPSTASPFSAATSPPPPQASPGVCTGSHSSFTSELPKSVGEVQAKEEVLPPTKSSGLVEAAAVVKPLPNKDNSEEGLRVASGTPVGDAAPALPAPPAEPHRVMGTEETTEMVVAPRNDREAWAVPSSDATEKAEVHDAPNETTNTPTATCVSSTVAATAQPDHVVPSAFPTPLTSRRSGAAAAAGERTGHAVVSVGLPSLNRPILSPCDDRVSPTDPPRLSEHKEGRKKPSATQPAVAPPPLRHHSSLTPPAVPSYVQLLRTSALPEDTLPLLKHGEGLPEPQQSSPLRPMGHATSEKARSSTTAHTPASAVPHDGASVASVPESVLWGSGAAASRQRRLQPVVRTPFLPATPILAPAAAAQHRRCRPSRTPRLSGLASSISSTVSSVVDRASSPPPVEDHYLSLRSERRTPREPTQPPRVTLTAHMSGNAAGHSAATPRREARHGTPTPGKSPLGVQPTTHPYCYRDLVYDAAGVERRRDITAAAAADSAVSPAPPPFSSPSLSAAGAMRAHGLVTSAVAETVSPAAAVESVTASPAVAAAAASVGTAVNDAGQPESDFVTPLESAGSAPPPAFSPSSSSSGSTRHVRSSSHRALTDPHLQQQERQQRSLLSLEHSHSAELDLIKPDDGSSVDHCGHADRLQEAAVPLNEVVAVVGEEGVENVRSHHRRHPPTHDDGEHKKHRHRRPSRAATPAVVEAGAEQRERNEKATHPTAERHRSRHLSRHHRHSSERGRSLTHDPQRERHSEEKEAADWECGGRPATQQFYQTLHHGGLEGFGVVHADVRDLHHIWREGVVPSTVASLHAQPGFVHRHPYELQRVSQPPLLSAARRQDGVTVPGFGESRPPFTAALSGLPLPAARLHARVHHPRRKLRRRRSSRHFTSSSSSSSSSEEELPEDGVATGAVAPARSSPSTTATNTVRGGAVPSDTGLEEQNASVPLNTPQPALPADDRLKVEVKQLTMGEGEGESLCPPRRHALSPPEHQHQHQQQQQQKHSASLRPLSSAEDAARAVTESSDALHRKRHSKHHRRDTSPQHSPALTNDECGIRSSGVVAPWEDVQHALVVQGAVGDGDRVMQPCTGRQLVTAPSAGDDAAPHSEHTEENAHHRGGSGRPHRRHHHHRNHRHDRQGVLALGHTRASPAAVVDVPTAALPGDLFYQDDDGTFHRINDDRELRAFLAAASPRAASPQTPLFVVHNPQHSTSPAGAPRSRSPTSRALPRRVWTITDPKSPLGCSRLNPYCATCRSKYDLIFVDADMRPLRWPSPQSPEVAQMGDCRVHSGYIFGCGGEEGGCFMQDATLARVRKRALYTRAWPERPHVPPGQLLVWEAEDGELPLRQLTPPPRGRFVPVSYDTHDAAAAVAATPPSLLPPCSALLPARAPSPPPPQQQRSASFSARLARTPSASSPGVDQQRRAKPTRTRRTESSRTEEELRRIYMPSHASSASTRQRSRQRVASRHRGSMGEQESARQPPYAQSPQPTEDTEQEEEKKRTEERRIKRALKQLLWRDLPQQRGTPEWGRYMRALSKELYDQHLL